MMDPLHYKLCELRFYKFHEILTLSTLFYENKMSKNILVHKNEFNVTFLLKWKSGKIYKEINDFLIVKLLQ